MDPEFVKYTETSTHKWLPTFYTDIITTSNLPEFKKAKVIALLKPSKDGSETEHYTTNFWSTVNCIRTGQDTFYTNGSTKMIIRATVGIPSKQWIT